MKHFTLIAGLLCCLCSASLFAQVTPYQNKIGSQGNEELWSSVFDSRTSHMVTVGGNNITTGPNLPTGNLWINEIALTGSIISSNAVQMPVGAQQYMFVGRDICNAPTDVNGAPTYYITGIQQPIGGNPQLNPQIFVARVTAAGAVLWIKFGYTQPSTAASEGIAVVAMPNDDVMVVGNAINYQGFLNVVAARFSSAGAQIWERYYARTAPWVAHEAIYNVAAQIGCTNGADAGVIIVGETNNDVAAGNFPGVRSFAMGVDGSGAECWRNVYPADYVNNGVNDDAFYDISYDNQGGYVCVGSANSTGPNGNILTGIYTARISPSGGLMCGAIYHETNNNGVISNLYARSVDPGLTPGTVTICGPNQGANNIFIAQLYSGNCGSTPIFANNYTNGATAFNKTLTSMLQYGVPEEITTVTFPNNPNYEGYFVTANASPGVHGGVDGHILFTDPNGTMAGNCPALPITLVSTPAGNAFAAPGTPSSLLPYQPENVATTAFTVSQNLCVQQPCNMAVTIAITQQNCASAVLSAVVSGGAAPYTFSWTNGSTSPSTTATASGNYCVVVTDINGCVASTCIPVTLQGQIGLQISATGGCGSTVLNALGGVPGAFYTYIWSNGATGNPITVNASGTYCVTIADANGCTGTACTGIMVNGGFSITTAVAGGGCGAQTITVLGLTPGALYTFNWSNGATTNPVTVNASGLYCVTVTDASGCTATACRQVQVGGNGLAVNFTYTAQNANCLRLNFAGTVTGGTAPYTYSWNFGGATPNTSTAASPMNITYPTAGSYNVCVTVTDATGCSGVICQTVQVGQVCDLSQLDFCYNVEPYGNTGFKVTINNVTSSCNGTSYITYSYNGGATWTTTAFKNFTTSGVYSVCVRVRCTVCGQTCYRTCCKDVAINMPCVIPASASLNTVSVNSNTGAATLTASTLSPAAAGYDWDWNGDGVIDSTGTANSAVHVYAPGTYTACVTIRRAGGCSKTACRTFTVDAPCNLSANFRSRYCTSSPLTIEYTALTANASNIYWDFGDGNTGTGATASHTYATAGTYTVCMFAMGAYQGCSARVCYYVHVGPANCTQPGPTPRLGAIDEEADGEMAEPEMEQIIAPEAGIASPSTIRVFPNPAASEATLAFNLSMGQESLVQVMSLNGTTVWQQKSLFTAGENQLIIPVGTLAPGIYYVMVNDGYKMLTAKLSVGR